MKEVLQWSNEEVEVAQFRKAVREPYVHSMFDFVIVIARKPI